MVVEDLTYDVKVDSQEVEELPKIQIKLLYPATLFESVQKLITVDEQVKALELQPIIQPKGRYFVKNKSLFPLIKQQEVVFFTLLEGEVLRGIIAGFSRYDITILDQGIPIVILRHSIYDLRNEAGGCFLKSFQQEHKDWEKSELFVE